MHTSWPSLSDHVHVDSCSCFTHWGPLFFYEKIQSKVFDLLEKSDVALYHVSAVVLIERIKKLTDKVSEQRTSREAY